MPKSRKNGHKIQKTRSLGKWGWAGWFGSATLFITLIGVWYAQKQYAFGVEQALRTKVRVFHSVKISDSRTYADRKIHFAVQIANDSYVSAKSVKVNVEWPGYTIEPSEGSVDLLRDCERSFATDKFGYCECTIPLLGPGSIGYIGFSGKQMSKGVVSEPRVIIQGDGFESESVVGLSDSDLVRIEAKRRQ